MRLRDYTAHVFVDGKKLEEYNVVKETPTRVTCWIASEEGKNFAVEWERHQHTKKGRKKKGRPADNDVAATLVIDGIECEYTLTLDPGEAMDISSICSDTGERDLVFSRVQIVDEEDLLDEEVHDELGEIRLNLYHGTKIDCVPGTRPGITVAGGDNKIHPCKKAVDHCVRLGPEREEAHLPLTSDWIVEPNDDPELDLIFKYRPLAVLQANGIVPRPPRAPSDREGSVNESESDPEHPDIKPDDVDDRIRILEDELRRLHDLKANPSKDRKRKRVKQDSEPRKRSLFVPGEIIDLT